MSATVTIDPAEAAHFGRMAADWWNPRGSSAMLHKLNPVRLGYIRAQLERAWDVDPKARAPLTARRVLDVGCGAGLLSEPLARLGAAVTGIDAAPENIAAARAHAEGQRLAIDYRAGEVESLGMVGFDLIVSMEVIEHVADVRAFVRALATMLADDGLLIVSTPNRTALSRLAIVGAAEGLGIVPKGTHDWSRFLTPPELTAHFEDAGLTVRDTRGISFSPAKGFFSSNDLSLDYFLTASR